MTFSTPEEAVRQALLRYCRGADRLDADLVRSAFWPDARITLGQIYSGDTEGFVGVAMGFMGMFTATRHEVGNMLLQPGPDGIAFEAYVRAWHVAGAKELVVLGRYVGRATLRPTGNGTEWRIAEHGELMDWGEERDADPAWFEANAELEKGRRDRSDGSYRLL